MSPVCMSNQGVGNPCVVQTQLLIAEDRVDMCPALCKSAKLAIQIFALENTSIANGQKENMRKPIGHAVYEHDVRTFYSADSDMNKNKYQLLRSRLSVNFVTALAVGHVETDVRNGPKQL